MIVRGKANAEVEFGNTLFIAKQNKGMIVDWKLEKEKTAEAKVKAATAKAKTPAATKKTAEKRYLTPRY